jgi:hypothetical protein
MAQRGPMTILLGGKSFSFRMHLSFAEHCLRVAKMARWMQNRTYAGKALLGVLSE